MTVLRDVREGVITGLHGQHLLCIIICLQSMHMSGHKVPKGVKNESNYYSAWRDTCSNLSQ